MSRKGLNIYKRKDGRWEARYIKSRNALGKPKYGYLYASSYREVRCDLQHTLQLQGKPSGSEERTRNSTFELVSMEWLDAFSINFKESTYIRYRTLIECYLMPSFQTVKIEKITKEMVRKLCKHLELHGKKDKTGLSPKTISDVLSVLRRILNYAGTLGIFVDSKVLDIRVKQTQKSLPILSLPRADDFAAISRGTSRCSESGDSSLSTDRNTYRGAVCVDVGKDLDFGKEYLYLSDDATYPESGTWEQKNTYRDCISQKQLR